MVVEFFEEFGDGEGDVEGEGVGWGFEGFELGGEEGGWHEVGAGLVAGGDAGAEDLRIGG